MKIIKYGEGYPIQICCTDCRSTLEIELNDILQTNNYDILQYVLKLKRYVICPVCGEENVIKEELVEYTVG